MTDSIEYEIVAGPSEFDLAIALFKGQKVSFKIVIPGDEDSKTTESPYEATIKGVQRVKTDACWNIEGHAIADTKVVGPIAAIQMAKGSVFIRFDIHKRTGTIKFLN